MNELYAEVDMGKLQAGLVELLRYRMNALEGAIAMKRRRNGDWGVMFRVYEAEFGQLLFHGHGVPEIDKFLMESRRRVDEMKEQLRGEGVVI